MPDAVDLFELALHLDRVRRRNGVHRAGAVTQEVPGGWLTARPGHPEGEFPSTSVNRVFWTAPPGLIGQTGIDDAVGALRALGCRRAYFWLAPWGWNEAVEAALVACGASLWPNVEYLTLVRRAGPCTPPRVNGPATQVLSREEAPALLAAMAPWYSDDGITTATRLVAEGLAEAHAVIEGDRPVALALLTMDGDWAYVFAAGTAPEFRARGAQTALICARVERAAACGARWCSVETNTAVRTSLNNLLRCGFRPAISWRVYRWDDPG